MGSSHSHTNVRDMDNASIMFNENATDVSWGHSNCNRIQMMKSADDSGEFPILSMAYTIGSKICRCSLSTSQDSVQFQLEDKADNPFRIILTIKRDGFGGLECKEQFKSLYSPSRILSDINRKIETFITSYSWSQREGLFVTEKRKNSKNKIVEMVTLAHCYVTQDIGLSIVAEVRKRWNDSWVIEVKGPYRHPAKDLLKVLDETCSRRVWSPSACPHCCPTQPNHGVQRFFRQFLNLLSSNQSSIPEGESMNYLGLVNNPGNIEGMLNGSVVMGSVTIQGKEN